MNLIKEVLINLRTPTILLFLSSCSETDKQETNSSKFIESKALSREAMQGMQTLEDGSTYSGEMLRGAPDGYGEKEFSNGDLYKGQFTKGLRHGHGTLRFKEDELLERYSGMWASDEWDGFGTLALRDGSRITGKWKNNSLEYGNYEGSNGEIKSGKWEGNWDYLGEGYVRNEFGAQFSGKLSTNGEYERGFLQNSNGDIYTGNFFKNQYHGDGILVRNNGDKYVGRFANNLYNGMGTLNENSGRMYSGQFKDGLPHGLGTLVDQNGVNYNGEWFEGVKQGSGKIDFGDGTSYTGQFRNGLAYEGKYDWGNGVETESYQDAEGNWKDR